jgi:hypothetical protein
MNASTIDKPHKASIKLSEYRSRGREPHVFRAEGPEGLIGAHTDLIAASLNPEERIHYLLYSPMREAGVAPFGIHAEPASHALAVTDHRFLISKDRHIDTVAPTVQNIPFSQVICVEIGSALLLGWIAIHFIENGQLSCASLFYTARGSHHFERVTHKFRQLHGKTKNHWPAESIKWTEIWEQTPKPQTEILKSIILEEEKPVYLFRSTETWGTEKRKRKQVCLAAEGLLLVTDCGLIYAVDERPIRPHIRSYGVNVYCIPPGALYSLAHIEKEEYGLCRHIFRLQAGTPPATIGLDIPFDGNANDNVADFLRTVQEMKR